MVRPSHIPSRHRKRAPKSLQRKATLKADRQRFASEADDSSIGSRVDRGVAAEVEIEVAIAVVIVENVPRNARAANGLRIRRSRVQRSPQARASLRSATCSRKAR